MIIERTVLFDTFDMIEKMCLNSLGDFSKGRVTVQETLHSTDVVKLIPKVIEGKLREAAEPVYLATRFMKTVSVASGNSAVYTIPIVGELTAHEISEGGRYPEEYIDFATMENGTFEIRVKKIGLRVSITEEAVTDGAWDIMGINISKMGRAMARYKEELCFNAFSDHGHPVFDNAIRAQKPNAGQNPSGRPGSSPKSGGKGNQGDNESGGGYGGRYNRDNSDDDRDYCKNEKYCENEPIKGIVKILSKFISFFVNFIIKI